MNNSNPGATVQGYILLRTVVHPTYRGVDRTPFEPVLIDDELTTEPIAFRDGPAPTWMFYPPGWRRDAYRLFESLTVSEWEPGDLLESLDGARQIGKIIAPHIGHHEIAYCEIQSLKTLEFPALDKNAVFWGYDVAYPGGDHYSAIYNGLVMSRESTLARGLLDEFRPLLNANDLFDTTVRIRSFVDAFRKVALSEAESDFVIYRLSSPTR